MTVFPRLKHGFVIFGRSKDIWMLCSALKMSINQAYIPLKALLGSAQHAVVETCRSFPCQSNLSAGGSGVVSAAHVVQSAREPVLHSVDPAGATDRPAHFRLVSGEDQPLCCTTPWRRSKSEDVAANVFGRKAHSCPLQHTSFEAWIV